MRYMQSEFILNEQFKTKGTFWSMYYANTLIFFIKEWNLEKFTFK